MKTTREFAREEAQKQVVSNLQDLLVMNYDANKGFKKAIKEAGDRELKEYLKVQAFMHQRYATQIDRLIHSLNHTPLEEGSTAGKFHRIYMDLILAISGNDDSKIMEECVRGQKATWKAYKEKLRNHNFPLEIKEVLKKHLVELDLTLEEVRGIKDLK